jgi:hypothetical protein
MLEVAPDATSASSYELGSDRVRTPSTVNALPGSKPQRGARDHPRRRRPRRTQLMDTASESALSIRAAFNRKALADARQRTALARQLALTETDLLARTAHPRGPVACPAGPRALGAAARIASCLELPRSLPNTRSAGLGADEGKERRIPSLRARPL